MIIHQNVLNRIFFTDEICSSRTTYMNFHNNHGRFDDNPYRNRKQHTTGIFRQYWDWNHQWQLEWAPFSSAKAYHQRVTTIFWYLNYLDWSRKFLLANYVACATHMAVIQIDELKKKAAAMTTLIPWKQSHRFLFIKIFQIFGTQNSYSKHGGFNSQNHRVTFYQTKEVIEFECVHSQQVL